MMIENDSSVHSGNYYDTGTPRVLAKLREMGVEVPASALQIPKHEGPGEPMREFTRIEHAILDWFEDRDYSQAQALIHYRPPRDEWHAILVINEEKWPFDLSDIELCPTRADALAAVINACDRDKLSLGECRKDGSALVVVIDGTETARIEPVTIEPLNLAVRDRVRQAFKGVRRDDPLALKMKHAAQLPGFKGVEAEPEDYSCQSKGCMLLGFPGNWAFAMRHALKQVGIGVKQSQAQELAAVFFGASAWHQLIKHEDAPNNGLPPVCVLYETGGVKRHNYYQTTEESIFAVGALIKHYTEPIVVRHFELSLECDRVIFWAATRRSLEKEKADKAYFAPNCIEAGCNDYWDAKSYVADETLDAARRILAKMDQDAGGTSPVGILYEEAGADAVLKGILARNGIPATQICHVGDHTLAVSYVHGPTITSTQAAVLYIFKVAKDGTNKIERQKPVAMYKARVRIAQDGENKMLIIGGNYGQHPDIEIPFTDITEIQRLIALTHREDLFTNQPPPNSFLNL